MFCGAHPLLLQLLQGTSGVVLQETAFSAALITMAVTVVMLPALEGLFPRQFVG